LENEEIDFKGDFQQNDPRFDKNTSDVPDPGFPETNDYMDFEPPPEPEAPEVENFEPDTSFQPHLNTSMMELQEQLAPMKKNSYKNSEKILSIMNIKIPVFDEYKTSEKQVETVASQFGMLKERPIKIKRGAITRLTAKTYELWKELKEAKKKEKNQDNLEKSTNDAEKSTMEKSTMDASKNETQLEPKSKNTNADVEPISSFIERMKFKHLRKLPSKNAHHAITYPELRLVFGRGRSSEKGRKSKTPFPTQSFPTD